MLKPLGIKHRTLHACKLEMLRLKRKKKTKTDLEDVSSSRVQFGSVFKTPYLRHSGQIDNKMHINTLFK